MWKIFILQSAIFYQRTKNFEIWKKKKKVLNLKINANKNWQTSNFFAKKKKIRSIKYEQQRQHEKHTLRDYHYNIYSTSRSKNILEKYDFFLIFHVLQLEWLISCLQKKKTTPLQIANQYLIKKIDTRNIKKFFSTKHKCMILKYSFKRNFEF